MFSQVLLCSRGMPKFVAPQPFKPRGHIFAQLAQTEEVRVVTDNILVNPAVSYNWHQDVPGLQSGCHVPLRSSEDLVHVSRLDHNTRMLSDAPHVAQVALRWWASVDSCTAGGGSPEYILGSHLNDVAERDTSFLSVLLSAGVLT
eukprot:778546-Amphidinium_carterae.1